MTMLKRQKTRYPVQGLSVRLEKPYYDRLTDFALKERFTLAAAISLLLDKALAAEMGAPYEPYVADESV